MVDAGALAGRVPAERGGGGAASAMGQAAGLAPSRHAANRRGQQAVAVAEYQRRSLSSGSRLGTCFRQRLLKLSMSLSAPSLSTEYLPPPPTQRPTLLPPFAAFASSGYFPFSLPESRPANQPTARRRRRREDAVHARLGAPTERAVRRCDHAPDKLSRLGCLRPVWQPEV